MSKASREIIKHYKKKCARKKSIKFRQVRVNEIEMISLAFYYSRARQQTKKRQLIDHQLSFSFSCAQDKTRTCTNVIVHYPLKVACLPISPPGRHCRISHFGCANIEFIFESAKFSDALCRKNDFFLPSALHRGSREVGGRLPQGGLGRLWRPEGGWLRGGPPGKP